MAMQWQYRSILIEYRKAGLFGRKYIDEQEVEEVLNEEGAEGWELVTATMVPDGLMLFCRHAVQAGQQRRRPDGPAGPGPELLGSGETEDKSGKEPDDRATVEDIRIF